MKSAIGQKYFNNKYYYFKLTVTFISRAIFFIKYVIFVPREQQL